MINQVSSEPNRETDGYRFQLFVAGDEPHSRLARENLNRICELHMEGRYRIETIDVFSEFERALENDIFITPALIKLEPGARIIIFGNLSDTETVLKSLALGVEE